MQAVGLSLNHHRHFLIVNHKIADLHHLKVGICPQGRLLPDMLLQLLQGGRKHIRIVHHISLCISYLQKNPRHHAKSHIICHILPQVSAADNHLVAAIWHRLSCPMAKKRIRLDTVMPHIFTLFLLPLPFLFPFLRLKMRRHRQSFCHMLLHAAKPVFQLLHRIKNTEGQLSFHLMVLGIINPHCRKGAGSKKQHHHQHRIHQGQLDGNPHPGHPGQAQKPQPVQKAQAATL